MYPSIKGLPGLLNLTLQIGADQQRHPWTSILRLTEAYCMSLQSLDLTIIPSLNPNLDILHVPNLRKLRLRASGQMPGSVTDQFLALLNAPKLTHLHMKVNALRSEGHTLDSEYWSSIPASNPRFPVLKYVELNLVADRAGWAAWLDTFIEREAHWQAQQTVVRLRIQGKYPWRHDPRLPRWPESANISAYASFVKRVPDLILELTINYLDLRLWLPTSRLGNIETLHLSSNGTATADLEVETFLETLYAPKLRSLRLRGSEGCIMRCVLERPDLELSLDIYLKEHAFKRDRLASIGRQLIAVGHRPSKLKALTCPELYGLSICGEDLLGES
jgi:hypothetical protein